MALRARPGTFALTILWSPEPKLSQNQQRCYCLPWAWPALRRKLDAGDVFVDKHIKLAMMNALGAERYKAWKSTPFRLQNKRPEYELFVCLALTILRRKSTDVVSSSD